jgi:hypothetical protein
MNTSPTWLTYAAAAIAALGLLLAAGGLAFNIATWKRSGRLAEATARAGAGKDGQPTLTVTVHSVGRQPIYVHRILMAWIDETRDFTQAMERAMGDPFDFSEFEDDAIVVGPPFGTEVPAGHPVTWVIGVSDRVRSALPTKYKLYARVVLGDRTTLLAKVQLSHAWAMALPPE